MYRLWVYRYWAYGCLAYGCLTCGRWAYGCWVWVWVGEIVIYRFCRCEYEVTPSSSSAITKQLKPMLAGAVTFRVPDSTGAPAADEHRRTSLWLGYLSAGAAPGLL